MSHHQQFLNNYDINDEIKKGGWRDVITQDRNITVKEHAEIIGEHYNLEDHIISRLVLQYKTFYGEEGMEKILYLCDTKNLVNKKRRNQKESTIPAVDIDFDDIELKVRVNIGDEYDLDCSYDSKFMLQEMDKIREALRDKFHWAPCEEIIYLVVDNAGGHGDAESI